MWMLLESGVPELFADVIPDMIEESETKDVFRVGKENTPDESVVDFHITEVTHVKETELFNNFLRKEDAIVDSGESHGVTLQVVDDAVDVEFFARSFAGVEEFSELNAPDFAGVLSYGVDDKLLFDEVFCDHDYLII
jgi:tRNA A-37 threonylcarbamoyl transferase component Bud32